MYIRDSRHLKVDYWGDEMFEHTPNLQTLAMYIDYPWFGECQLPGSVSTLQINEGRLDRVRLILRHSALRFVQLLDVSASGGNFPGSDSLASVYGCTQRALQKVCVAGPGPRDSARGKAAANSTGRGSRRGCRSCRCPRSCGSCRSRCGSLVFVTMRFEGAMCRCVSERVLQSIDAVTRMSDYAFLLRSVCMSIQTLLTTSEMDKLPVEIWENIARHQGTPERACES